MAMQVNELIVASDVTDSFINKFRDTIYAASGLDDLPRFNSQRGIGDYGENLIGELNKPVAVIKEDLENRSNYLTDIGMIKIPKNQLIKAQDVYNALMSIFRKLVQTTSYTSHWYHQVQGTLGLVETKSGNAVFKPQINSTVHAWPGGQGNTYVYGWERDVGSYNTPPSFSFTVNQVAQKMTIETFINTLINEWTNARTQRKVVYKLYTCHANCHNNCHSRRGRR